MQAVTDDNGMWFFEESPDTPVRLVAHIPNSTADEDALVLGWPGAFNAMSMATLTTELLAVAVARSPWTSPRLKISSYGLIHYEETWSIEESGLAPVVQGGNELSRIGENLPLQLANAMTASLSRVADRPCPMAIRVEAVHEAQPSGSAGIALWSRVGLDDEGSLLLPYGSSSVEAQSVLIAEARVAVANVVAESSVSYCDSQRVDSFIFAVVAAVQSAMRI